MTEFEWLSSAFCCFFVHSLRSGLIDNKIPQALNRKGGIDNLNFADLVGRSSLVRPSRIAAASLTARASALSVGVAKRAVRSGERR